MADLSRFFLVENGLSFDDNVSIFSGNSDPSVVGEAAPIGSLYLSTNGSLYHKFGTAYTDWALVSAESATVRISSSDTTSGFLNDKLAVTSSLTKTLVPNTPGAQTLLIDLSNTGVSPGTYHQVTVDAKGRVLSAFNPTTLLGYGITDAQPLNPNLTALSNISAGSPPVGLYTITGTGTSEARAIQGTTDQIVVLNGDGVTDNPTLSIAPNVVLPGTAGFIVPIGTSAQEIQTIDGTIRYNTDLGKFRFYQDGQWLNFGSDLVLYEENLSNPAVPTAGGQNSVAIGEAALASGQNSIALGASEAAGSQSTALGNGAKASSYGQLAFSARASAAAGSAQGAEYVYSGQTIAQYPIELFLDGVSQRAVFSQPNTAVSFVALVIGQRVDVPGELFSAKIDGQMFRGNTASATQVYTVKSLWGLTYQDMDANILADTNNGTFNVKVTGKAGQTWRWVVRVSAVESVL